MGPYDTFAGIKEKGFYSSTLVHICLQSSRNSSTDIYFGLVTQINSSTLVYIPLWLVYVSLHLFTLI